MRSFSDWLAPTLLGPLLTTWALTTLGAILVGTAVLTAGTVDDWLVAMLLGSFFACSLGVVLVAVDILLLRAKMRQLPTGGRAWISSLLCPLAVYFIWTLPFLPLPDSGLTFVLFFALPMGAAALGLRMLFGRPCSANS